MTGAARCRGLIHAENARLVAVECQRLAVPLEILTRCLEVTEGRLGDGEQDMHHAAGRIVDIDQRRARRGAILEPTMLATVDLHEFAKTRAPQSWLVNLRWSQLAWNPQTYGDLQPADSLFGERDVMLGSELLGCQGGPKIRVRDLRSSITRSATVSSRRLLLGRLNRSEINPTGPSAV